ncbi:Transferase [Macleaya cordata]|uniref:Transferase n=1 Tax=Macleaya cordata TaxID=56857 RepID=A0A200Q0V6_MACCD|nr:Transferase [Macleaya cordata]
MHADPNCATLLMKSWTDVYRRQSISHSPFFHPPGLRGRTTNPNTSTKSANFYASKSKSQTTSVTSSKMSTVTFRFSDSMIKTHLSEIQTSCPNASPFDFLTAMFWLSVLHAKTNTKTDQPCKISIGIDFRKLLEAPLPHGFFGNALHFSSVSSDEEEIKQGGLEYFTRIIHENRTSLNEEEFWSGIEWFESQKDGGGKFTTPFRMYGPELTSVNLEHMFAYAAVLEDKKPLHVSYHIENLEGEGLILVLPSPEEGLGRTVMITLPEDQTAKICRDSNILRLEPTMIVSGKH